MPWFKVDDGFHCHPKILAAGNAAIGLWTRCGSYVSDQITDGFVPETVAKLYGKPSEIRSLLEVGLWAKTAGGYQMHDYHDFNPTAEKVLADRDAAAERQREWREKRKAEKAAEAAMSQRDKPVSHGHVTRPRPDPTRPDPIKTLTQHGSLGAPVAEMKTIEDWAERRRLA
jgi:hypothetical protein